MAETIKSIENNESFGILKSKGINVPFNFGGKEYAFIIYKNGKILPKFKNSLGRNNGTAIKLDTSNYNNFKDGFIKIIEQVVPGSRNFPENYVNIAYNYHFGSGEIIKDSKLQIRSEKKKVKISEHTNEVIPPKVQKKIEIPKVENQVLEIETEKTSYLENGIDVIPKKGEGMYSLLGRYGLKGALSVGLFQDINSKIIGNNNSLSDVQSYKLPLIEHTVSKGQNLTQILKLAGLSAKYLNMVFDYNKKYNPLFQKIKNPSSINPGLELYIPMWNTGFYSNWEYENKKNKTVTPELKDSSKTKKVEKAPGNNKAYKGLWETNDIKNSFNYTQWIDSIDVISNELKGKVFLIDPGHGAVDGGSNPQIRDGNGKKVKVLEAPSVLDISYRLAKIIKQKGGKVYLTHYSHSRGITSRRNLGKVPDFSDIDSSIGKTWSAKTIGGVSGASRTLRKRAKYANSIKNNGSSKNTFFLSIHADYDGRGKQHNPITLKYYKGSHGLDKEGKKFAEKLATNIVRNGDITETGGQGLYVLDDKYNKMENKVLIELVNMRNDGGAWLLRSGKGRQQFADIIGNGLVKSLK